MASFPNNSPHHVPAEDHNNPHGFFDNNATASFDPALHNGSGEAFDQGWPIQYDQEHLVPNDQNARWQDELLRHRSAQNLPGQLQQHVGSDPYSNAFTTASEPFQTPPYNVYNGPAGLSDFRNLPYGPSSTISPSNIENRQAQLPQTSIPNGHGQPNTVVPGALDSRISTSFHPSQAVAEPSQFQNQQAATLSERNVPTMPPGITSGSFTITSRESLNDAVASRPLTAFLNLGNEAFDLPTTKSTIPVYNPRKSRNEIKRLLATDSRLSAKISKKPSRKSGLDAPRSIPSRLDAAGRLSTQKGSRSEEPSSSEESETESDYDSSEDEAEKAPLPALRPTDPSGATRYDTIRAVWRYPGQSVSGESIREGLKSFWEIIQTIRDRWKSDTATVKQAEEAKKNNEIPLLKHRVKDQRDMLEVALKAAVEFGHPDVVDHVGTAPAFMGALAVFLQDRARDSDYSGSLTQVMLEFLSRCKMLETGLMEKSGIGKLLLRFQKRGDDRTKSLAKRITDNAIAASKKKKDGGKVAPAASGQLKGPQAASEPGPKSPPQSAGVKRARPAEGSTEQVAKRIASNPGDHSPVKAKVGQAASSKTTSAVALPAKTKTVAAATKPSGFFSALQSAAKKPGTAITPAGQAKSAQQKPATEKKVVSPASAPAPAFSFADAMADLTKPKESKPIAKTEDRRAPETAEEKAKRLRKEARRKLRVTFRPGAELVEVFEFEHFPEEDLGHDAAQTRDVGDVGSEGKMFKMQHDHPNMMDMDEEDEDAGLLTIDDLERGWQAPAFVNFDVLTQEQRESNFEPHGGGMLKPEMPEGDVQREREANTLLVVYSQQSDIPPTPKEPAASETEEKATPAKMFGSVPDHITSRIEETKRRQAAPAGAGVGSSPTDIAALLSAFNQPGSSAPQSSQPSTGGAGGMAGLESLISQLAGGAAVPQQPQTAVQRQADNTPDVSAIMAALNTAPTQAAQSWPQAQSAQSRPSGGTQGPDLGSILSFLQQQQQPPAVQAPPANQVPAMPPMGMMPPMGPMPGMGQGTGNDMGAWQQWMAQAHQFASQGMPEMAGFAQAAAGGPFPHPTQPQHQQQAPFENEERRRLREHGGAMGDGEEGSGFRARKRNKSPPKFVVQCKYWKEGKCRKGADCTFRHDP